MCEGIDQIIFRFFNDGLKVNDKKLHFGFNDIHYFGYEINWEGINPKTNKLQGILDLVILTNKTESLFLIGMLQ